MRIIAILLLSIIFFSGTALPYQSLQEVFEAADSAQGYDKYVELDPAIDYEGDLWMYQAGDVYLNGHGARIYGTEYVSVIGVFDCHLDVTGCVMIGGLGGVYVGSDGSANIYNNTILDGTEAGVKTYYISQERQTQIYDNIISGSKFGVMSVDLNWPHYIGYNNMYALDSLAFLQFVPG